MQVQMIMHKAEKYALDAHCLTDEQKTFLLQNFGCARKVYNLFVDNLYTQLESLGYKCGDLPKEVAVPPLSLFKKDKRYAYLKEADSLGLSNARVAFVAAVKRYKELFDHKNYTKRALRRAKSGTEELSFRGLKGMPKFHSRANGDFSYATDNQHPNGKNGLKQDTIRLTNGSLHLPKCPLDFKLICHRPLPDGAVIGRVTMSMDVDGKFYASVAYSYPLEMDMTLRNAALNGDSSILDDLTFLGLDYSQQDFYVDSEGRKANYPHFYRKSEVKLAQLQNQLSKKAKGSRNYKKLQLRIRKLHKKIANQRRDFLQKLSTELVKSYDVIAVENIDLRAMGGALSLGKNLHDNGFGMFRDMIAYKQERKGSVLVKIPRYEPSTKRCHVCGFVNRDVVLGVKGWDCPNCGAHHLRDENAAINICNVGKAIFLDYFAQWIADHEQAASNAASRKAARLKARHPNAA